jgi:hypothetical protein
LPANIKKQRKHLEFRCFFHIFAGRKDLTDLKQLEYEKDYAIGDGRYLDLRRKRFDIV